MQTFMHYIIGTENYPLYAAQWFFALIGIIISSSKHLKNRDVDSPHTPRKFSWKFFILDNGYRFAIMMLLVFVFMRFSVYFLEIQFIADNVALQFLYAFGIGYFNDRLSIWLKKINFFGLNNSPVRKKSESENDSPSDSGDPAAGK